MVVEGSFVYFDLISVVSDFNEKATKSWNRCVLLVNVSKYFLDWGRGGVCISLVNLLLRIPTGDS